MTAAAPWISKWLRFPGPIMELQEQRAVGVCEYWRDEETGHAEPDVVAAPLETQRGRPPLRAGRV
eukprot:10106325-Lingulodinium_polyedra.AAC.1